MQLAIKEKSWELNFWFLIGLEIPAPREERVRSMDDMKVAATVHHVPKISEDTLSINF